VLDAPAFRIAGSDLASEYDNLLACIRCGLCLTSCPTYVLTMHESEGPRGRVGMARALAEGHLALTADLVEHELNCLVCDACSAVCPAGVHMDPIQVALRPLLERARRYPWHVRLARHVALGWLFMDMRRFRAFARLMWLYQRSGLQWLARASGVLRLLRLSDAERLLPRLPSRFMAPADPAKAEATALMFAGCVMSTALADVDRATVRVLEKAGYTVAAPNAQGCCGALHAHSGDLPNALDLARRNIEAFEGTDAPIVVNSAGCGAWLKDYAHQLRDDSAWADRAERFSERVRDLSEAIVGRLAPDKNMAARVVYQDACHLLHAQRISRQPRELLSSIPQLELLEIKEAGLCCGSAGIYNLTNPQESGQLRERKLDNALDVEPSLIVTGNPGCLFQLQAGLRERGSKIEVKHLATVLDEAT
jgi:glycolate oxidase iron-sulfur subunit